MNFLERTQSAPMRRGVLQKEPCSAPARSAGADRDRAASRAPDLSGSAQPPPTARRSESSEANPHPGIGARLLGLSLAGLAWIGPTLAGPLVTALTPAAAALAISGSSASAQTCFAEEPQFGAGATIPVAWADCDGDGDADLAVGNYGQPNQLFVNNGDGTFVEQAQFGAGATFALAWADFDNDGDPDMAVGNGNGQQNYLYINNGDGTYTQQARFGLNRTIAMAWADCDLDGDLDLAVGNGLLGVAQQNYLYRNNGDGTFSEEAQFGQGQSASLVWGDVDGDGDPDLAVGNGGFNYVGQNYLYINNGDGAFTERADFGELDTACLAFADVDDDGDLDLAVGNWNNGQSYLYRNDGLGNFTAEPDFGALDTNGFAWGDCDNDGDLDLAVGNGDFGSAGQNYLYLNDGNGVFTEQAEFGLGSTDAVAWADAEGDGDLDLALGNEHSPPQNNLQRNCRNPGTYLSVRLLGHFHDRGPGFSNRDGIGSRVLVYPAGMLGQPDQLLGFREIGAHGGFAAQDLREAHFGLPGRTEVDLRIIWPGSSGTHFVQDLTGVPTNQVLLVEEENPPAGISEPSRPDPTRDSGLSLPRVRPNPAVGEALIEWAPGPRGATRVEILDPAGRCIRTLAARPVPGGSLLRARWNGVSSDGRQAPRGIYFLRIPEGGGEGMQERLLLVR